MTDDDADARREAILARARETLERLAVQAEPEPDPTDPGRPEFDLYSYLRTFPRRLP